MKFIKIDPQNRTVDLIESDGSLKSLYELIDCQMIDICARQDNGDALIVDDEALFLEPQPAAFTFGDYRSPIHGIAVLAGSDDEGGNCEPTSTLEQVRNLVTWVGEIHTVPFLEVIGL